MAPILIFPTSARIDLPSKPMKTLQAAEQLRNRPERSQHNKVDQRTRWAPAEKTLSDSTLLHGMAYHVDALEHCEWRPLGLAAGVRMRAARVE